VADASVLGAVAFREPGHEAWAKRLVGVSVFAPSILQFEMASIAWKKIRKHPKDGVAILTQLRSVLNPTGGIQWMDVDVVDVVLVAKATGLTTYDASYLWLAGSLGADLLTLDARLAGTISDSDEAATDPDGKW
jgi:predicted nucleic acid-binding protein